MLTLRPSNERGKANFGWLDSAHSFSFGQYYDPAHMGFGALRVINEDKVAPGAGFGTHPHQNMEIISYVLEGELAHKDSAGNTSVIRPGRVQRMSAGTGISHSEFNNSDSAPVHFLQIWVLPDKVGLKPGYEEKQFDLDKNANHLVLLASRDNNDGALKIHQNVDLYAAKLEKNKEISFSGNASHRYWLQLAKGSLSVNNTTMSAGDGLAVEDEALLTIAANDNAEFLLFDIA